MHDAYDDLALHRDASVNRRAYWRIYLPRPAPRKQRGAGERV